MSKVACDNIMSTTSGFTLLTKLRNDTLIYGSFSDILEYIKTTTCMYFAVINQLFVVVVQFMSYVRFEDLLD